MSRELRCTYIPSILSQVAKGKRCVWVVHVHKSHHEWSGPSPSVFILKSSPSCLRFPDWFIVGNQRTSIAFSSLSHIPVRQWGRGERAWFESLCVPLSTWLHFSEPQVLYLENRDNHAQFKRWCIKCIEHWDSVNELVLQFPSGCFLLKFGFFQQLYWGIINV